MRFHDPVYSAEAPLVQPRDLPSDLQHIRRPVALTGGTGFVGSHLVDTLCAAGITPRVLVRDAAAPRWIAAQKIDWVEGDLADLDSLQRLVTGAGTVLHLAGVLRGATAGEFMAGNRDGTAHVVSAIKSAARGARFVYVSSQAAIGPSAESTGLGPDAPLQPISSYGRSKAAAESVVVTSDGAADWCIVRPPAVFGPRDTDVFEFFRLAARGILAYPAGERWLTLAFVADVVKAVLAAACNGQRGTIYHVGMPHAMRMRDLLETIAEAGGVRARNLPLPPWVFKAAGAGASALRAAGLRRIPLSRDKATEILARHWTLATEPSLAALGIDETINLFDGALTSWTWYRTVGWLG